ncbi:MAG: zinc metallopeptidase [Chromatiales bacterium]|nr:zinc metallopeptidase [Chromatiales bacterium]
MRWRTGRRSSNVEDRRGMRVGMPRGRMGRGVAGGGLGVVVMVVIAMFLGVDPSIVLQQGGIGAGAPPAHESGAPPSAAENELAEFVSVVLADTEDTWNALFQASGERYQEPRLVLFSGAVQSACGFAQSAMGPFYCPGDQKVYIDLSFYRDLRERHGAPGDFAQAYVIAHEVGHHVQNLVGISGKVHEARRRVGEAEGNALSVRLELQADCLAGVWAHHADRVRNLLERGDVEEALRAASAIGDDRLQKQARGYVTPESFTHGTSEQRMRWFRRGLDAGRFDACNTFEGARL